MEEILSRLINGDIKAFDELVKYYEPELFHIALVRVKDEYLAHEAVQDTFVTVYSNIPKIKRVKCFNYWIIRILINICNKKYRKRIFSEVWYEDVNQEVFMKEDENIQNLLNKMSFLKLINFLGEKDRTLMILFYKYEYTTKEISKIIGMNENTVRTRIKRARNLIKEKMDGGNDER